jgi:hypothetical protein
MAVMNLLMAAKTALVDSILADGAVGPLLLNKNGRLKVDSKHAVLDMVLGNLTSIGTVLIVDVSEASSVTLHAKNTGTVSGTIGVATFEASIDSTNGTDGTWFPMQVSQANANVVATGSTSTTLAANAALSYAYRGSVSGFRWMRIRQTTAAATNVSSRWTVSRSTENIDNIPVLQQSSVAIVGTVPTTLPTGLGFGGGTSADTNLTAIVSVARNLTEFSATNNSAAKIYFKFYNKNGIPTLASDIPWLIIPVDIGETVQQSFGITGKRFTLGIGMAITGGIANTDTTAVAANIPMSLTYL